MKHFIIRKNGGALTIHAMISLANFCKGRVETRLLHENAMLLIVRGTNNTGKPLLIEVDDATTEVEPDCSFEVNWPMHLHALDKKDHPNLPDLREQFKL